jgi:hypothetical protein
MFRFYPLFLLILTFAFWRPAFTQNPSSPAPVSTSAPKTDTTQYSKEAAIVEQIWNTVTFSDDGNSVRDQIARVRVQTDAGVKQWGLLTLPFQSATQTVEIDYVRVRKPDGSVVTTSADNVQDLDSEITRAAPFYSDLREKHIAVKGLATGDVLEYSVHWHGIKPLIPGQFWFDYNFQHDGIVLDEKFESEFQRRALLG